MGRPRLPGGLFQLACRRSSSSGWQSRPRSSGGGCAAHDRRCRIRSPTGRVLVRRSCRRDVPRRRRHRHPPVRICPNAPNCAQGYMTAPDRCRRDGASPSRTMQPDVRGRGHGMMSGMTSGMMSDRNRRTRPKSGRRRFALSVPNAISRRCDVARHDGYGDKNALARERMVRTSSRPQQRPQKPSTSLR
jgi:hypothetical protein